MKSLPAPLLLILSAVFFLVSPARADLVDLPEFMWVQDAAGGTLTGTDPSNMTLTLRNVREHVTQFSDRPYKLTTLVANDLFFFNWPMTFATSPPNATLSYRSGSDPRPVNLVMTLSEPKYDRKKKLVTYHAAVMNDAPQILQSALGNFKYELKKLPKHFSSASLFIDGSKNYNCSVGQAMYFKSDLITYTGVINYLSIGTTELKTDLHLVDPTDVSSPQGLNAAGVVSNLFFDGGATQPLTFSFLVSVENKVKLETMIYGDMPDKDIRIGFTIYYYDPVSKGYYTAFWTQNATLTGTILVQGQDLALNVSDIKSTEIPSPILFPVRLSVAPTPGVVQNIHVQYSRTAKATINWGTSP
jgi:hypothetical protein